MALGIEPRLKILSPSVGGLPSPSRSPKPFTDVSPSRMAPMTTAGTLVSMMKTCPLKPTISSSSALARAGSALDATAAMTIATNAVARKTVRSTLVAIRRSPRERARLCTLWRERARPRCLLGSARGEVAVGPHEQAERPCLRQRRVLGAPDLRLAPAADQLRVDFDRLHQPLNQAILVRLVHEPGLAGADDHSRRVAHGGRQRRGVGEIGRCADVTRPAGDALGNLPD